MRMVITKPNRYHSSFSDSAFFLDIVDQDGEYYTCHDKAKEDRKLFMIHD